MSVVMNTIFKKLIFIALLVHLSSKIFATPLLRDAGSSTKTILRTETDPSFKESNETVVEYFSTARNTTTTSIDDEQVICASEPCIKAADEMLSRMNLSVDPCEDFYEFACGKYVHEIELPPERTFMDSFSAVDDKIMNQTLEMLRQPINNTVDIPPIKAIKNLFASCMDEELIEERGEEPIKQLLKRFGGWPILEGDTWNETNWSWIDSVVKMKTLGIEFDSIIDHPNFGIDEDFLLKGFDEPYVKAYYDYIKQTAIALGADNDLAEMEAEEIVNFEIDLVKICSSKESRLVMTRLYNPLTIRELQLQYQFVNWLAFLNLLLPSQSQVNENQIVSVADLQYFQSLGPLLKRTPKRILANYLAWNIAGRTVKYSSSKLRQINVNFKSLVLGQNKRDERWKECIEILGQKFKILIGAMYVKEYFQQDSKLAAAELVDDIRNVFQETLKNRNWMDESTRMVALAKLEKMSAIIAFPEELLDDQLIIDYYKDLNVIRNVFFESALNSFGVLFDKDLEKIHEPVSKNCWKDLMFVAEANAFYSQLNEITIPAGILQGHFFSALRPKYLNYGAVGFVIGHEITHGFDNLGNQFDSDGNLRQWWQNDTLELFHERAQCFIEQYGNFTDTDIGLQLNGITTQSENIADTGGILLAYKAYRKWVNKHGTEKQLPRLNLSPNQLFWLSAAQTYCTVYKLEQLKYTIVADQHSPGRFRVLGSMMNSKDFSRDFNCPSGWPMNPLRKCEMW